MCEVRRAFHNVNTDPNKAISLPSIRIIQQNSDRTKKQLLQNREDEVPVSAKENVTVDSGKNITVKKTQKVVENDFSEPKLLTSLKIIEGLKDIGHKNKSKKFAARSTFQSQANNRKLQVPKLNILRLL